MTDSLHPVPTRLDVDAAVPAFSKAMAHLDTTATRELDRVGDPRAGSATCSDCAPSQLNGCAYCVDMHSKDAAENGESTAADPRGRPCGPSRRFFTEKERRGVRVHRVGDPAGRDARADRPTTTPCAAHWSPDEVGALLALIVAINAWNMLAVATRAWEPELDEPELQPSTGAGAAAT